MYETDDEQLGFSSEKRVQSARLPLLQTKCLHCESQTLWHGSFWSGMTGHGSISGFIAFLMKELWLWRRRKTSTQNKQFPTTRGSSSSNNSQNIQNICAYVQSLHFAKPFRGWEWFFCWADSDPQWGVFDTLIGILPFFLCDFLISDKKCLALYLANSLM